MAITKEQWSDIERELSYANGTVTLVCDAYRVNVLVVPVDTLQYGIMVYVNGKFEGRWLIEDCEERRRFMRPLERFLWSARERAAMLKRWGGKRASKDQVERINRKNNKELEVVSIGGAEVVVLDAEPVAA